MISQVIIITTGLVAIAFHDTLNSAFVLRNYGPIFFMTFPSLFFSVASSVKWGYRIFGGRDV